MCKPASRMLPLASSDGPCFFHIRMFSNACAAFSLGESWRASLANVLRKLADKAEGASSMTVVAKGPPVMNFSDVEDAMVVGFNGATQYLNDLWRDRVFGAEDTEAGTIQPAGMLR